MALEVFLEKIYDVAMSIESATHRASGQTVQSLLVDQTHPVLGSCRSIKGGFLRLPIGRIFWLGLELC